MASVKVTTTGTPAQVIINDLGRKVFTHPVTDYELMGEYSMIDLSQSNDLQAAVDAGEITVTFNGKTLSDVRDVSSEDPSFSGTTGTVDEGKGSVPDDGVPSTGNRFLRDDGLWAVPPGAAGSEYYNDKIPAGTSTDEDWNTIASISETFNGGDYLIHGAFLWTTSNTAAQFIAELLIDGTAVWDMNPRPPLAGEKSPGGFKHQTTLTAGAHTIELRYKSGLAGKLAWIYNTVLEIETERD
jgi:hypothetical protein